MNLIVLILEIFIILISGGLFVYAQQKGRNQADKQDLKQLTEIVEEVKRKSSEELELLRSNLALLSNRHLQIFSEEKDAIIKFYSQLNSWVWDSLNFQLSEFNHVNYSELSGRIIKMRDAYNATNVTFSKVKLLISEDDLIKLGHETILDTLKLHQFKEGLALKLERNLSSEKIVVDQIISGKFDFQKISSEMGEFYSTEAKERQDEREAIFKEYMEDHIKYFRASIQKMHEFEQGAKSYLKN